MERGNEKEAERRRGQFSGAGDLVLSLKACKLNHEETEWEANTAPLLSAAVQNSG